MQISGKRPATPVEEGIVLGLASFVVFLLTRTRDVGGDGTVFAMAVERVLEGHRPSWQFLHPHHLLYNPLVAATVALLRLLGIPILSLDGGAVVSAAAGAAVVGGLVVILRRSGVDEILSLLAAAGAAVSAGLWGFSTQMEVYTLEAFAALVWLAAVSRREPRPAATGGSLFLAMLSHLAASLLVLPTLLRFRKEPRRALGAVVPAMIAAGAAVIAALIAGSPALPLVARLERIVPASNGSYLGHPSLSGAAHALAALGPWRWYDSVHVIRPGWPAILDTAGAAAAFMLLGSMLLGAVSAVRRRSRLGIMALLGLAAFLPLWLVWDTGNVEHTVVAVPFLAVLAALGADALPRRWSRLLLGLAVIVLGVTNAVGSAIPQSRPENGRIWIEAGFIRSHTAPDAVLLTAGLDARERLGFPYLTGRRIMDLTLLVQAARRQSLPPRAALGPWLRAGRRAHEVWVIGDLWTARTAAIVSGLGIGPPAWHAAVGRLVPLGRESLDPVPGVLATRFVLTRVRVE